MNLKVAGETVQRKYKLPSYNFKAELQNKKQQENQVLNFATVV